MRNIFLKLRRALLQRLVPEFIWPKTVNVDGVTVKLRGAPYSFSVKRLLAKDADSYERAERGLLRVLKPDDHVLEYGSSIGILTALICERVPNGKVVSVEASASLVEYSRSWLDHYEHLTLVNAAAFPVYHRLDLSLSFNDTSGSLGGIVNYNNVSSLTPTLESFFIIDAENISGFKPTALVIDIEGSEDIILKEKMDLPDSINKILIELHSFIYGNEVATKIITQILEQGFVLIERSESVYLFLKKDG